MSFQPDYRNIVQAARNETPARIPLYDHKVGDGIISKIMGEKVGIGDGSAEALSRYFELYDRFFLHMGYDTVTFEGCITRVLPGGGALGNHADPAIKTREDFEKYPFDKVPALYAERFGPQFDALRAHMPEGMKAIGGVGNGVFEITQDLVGYENLMLLTYDDEELYSDLFKRVGAMMREIWSWFLRNYADVFCVCRFGDDLGYKSATLMAPDEIRGHIIPEYAKIVSLVHEAGRPFLLHSCGCIFDVFDDIINVAGIDAKHSNEDAIAPFSRWVDEYGDRIGNFGGVDTDHLVRTEDEELVRIVRDVYEHCKTGHGGIAIGSGNSIPDYVDVNKYVLMTRTVRECRGDKL